MEILPVFFGIMGLLTSIILFATVWFWMKYNETENDDTKNIATLRLIGYSLLIMSSWFTCGIFSVPGYVLRPEKVNYDFAIPIAYVVMILLFLGFLFLLIGERKAFLAKKRKEKQ
jgi:hypothetical protein